MTKDIIPIKVFDYMAMGKPVISTRLPGMVQEFGENNGIIYVENPGDSINKALDLSKNNNIADSGLKAKNFVKDFSWDKAANEFEYILDKAIKQINSV